MTKFPVGALHNDEYCLPCNAVKGLKYTCPECGEPVIVRKGEVRIHHFAHKSGERDCKFYNHPGEGEIHKLVKHTIADLLRKRKIENVKRLYPNLPLHIKHKIDCEKKIEYEEGDEIITEYRVNEKCIVDVALINNGRLKYVFEICDTHKTTRDETPEPWFEINAKDFLSKPESNTVFCIRTDFIDILKWVTCNIDRYDLLLKYIRTHPHYSECIPHTGPIISVGDHKGSLHVTVIKEKFSKSHIKYKNMLKIMLYGLWGAFYEGDVYILDYHTEEELAHGNNCTEYVEDHEHSMKLYEVYDNQVEEMHRYFEELDYQGPPDETFDIQDMIQGFQFITTSNPYPPCNTSSP
tara:strand:- start:23 stop:1075 length:1053 start_codon:yes stop_codon:yes gene_type:complete